MKKKWILAPVAAVMCLMASSCGPIVSGGPDVVVGGGIYPAPIPIPGPGPNVFRPGAPYGPGFRPGLGAPGNRPGGPVYTPGRVPVPNNPGFGPGNPGPSGNATVSPGGPGGGPGGPGGGPGGPGGPF